MAKSRRNNMGGTSNTSTGAAGGAAEEAGQGGGGAADLNPGSDAPDGLADAPEGGGGETGDAGSGSAGAGTPETGVGSGSAGEGTPETPEGGAVPTTEAGDGDAGAGVEEPAHEAAGNAAFIDAITKGKTVKEAGELAIAASARVPGSPYATTNAGEGKAEDATPESPAVAAPAAPVYATRAEAIEARLREIGNPFAKKNAMFAEYETLKATLEAQIGRMKRKIEDAMHEVRMEHNRATEVEGERIHLVRELELLQPPAPAA